MTPLFADTSLFVSFLNKRDDFHAKAVEFLSDVSVPLVTTAWVLVELGNFLGKGRGRLRYAPSVADLRAEKLLKIVPAADVWFDRGLALYARRGDKRWSMIDCISCAVMEDTGLQDALTTDHHFEQAGFSMLLK